MKYMTQQFVLIIMIQKLTNATGKCDMDSMGFYTVAKGCQTAEFWRNMVPKNEVRYTYRKGGNTLQKLKIEVLYKMIQQKLTSTEVNFMVYISHFQDDSGNVQGVHYQKACRELGISHQKFYDTLRGLKKKRIILLGKEFYSDWNIKILGNDFSYPEAFSEGYLNMAHSLFYDRQFLTLKAGEKLLAMELLRISEVKRNQGAWSREGGYKGGQKGYCIGVENFYEKYTQLLGVTKRVVQKYMSSLRGWFSIGIQKKLYWITPLKKVWKRSGEHTDAEAYNGHIGDVICRRERISYTRETFQDAVRLISQYADQLKEKASGVFMEAVKESIIKSNERVKNTGRWRRILQPKLIHKLINEYIFAMEKETAIWAN